ncbi:amidohydrolase family protein [Nocardioides anomalus]|uniref:Amidohydrolase family protein n=1 Tax=Nocardioides anomalus TaxID=2712223 RepID=A0A6G6WHG1_9ACTN|nr:amidohydrolase family protein [Nocardioides anomalus]QIG44597.1 amidohydrolase family protein [Nocardioides anomalus]
MSEPVVDAHVHVWDLARRPQRWIDPVTMSEIARDHPVGELEAELRSAHVTGSVLVQVLNDPGETDDFLWAGRSPVVDGVVGWVDLLDPGVGEALDALGAHPSGTPLVGVRHQALAEADPAAWLARAGAGPGLSALEERGLACDLILRPEHLDVARDVLGAHPGTTFVLDHAGKAPVLSGWGSADADHWAARVARLARLPHVLVKLSGLTTMGDLARWEVADLRPWVEHLLELFGADRVLFGSDWPVSRRAGDYARTLEAARALVAGLSPGERAAVMGETARRAYRLETPR